MITRPGEIIERVVDETGLDDFGIDGWQDGLDALVAAVDTDLADDDHAHRLIEGLIENRLRTRLGIEDWYRDAPSDGPPPVEAPIVIVGLPRTGTTAIHHLLANEPEVRYLRQWERDDPLPPPRTETEASDPRRPTDTSGTVHHIAAIDGPVEDGPVHGYHFHAETALPLPTYMRWWRETSHRSSFEFHERFLRLLHVHRPPRRWLLKYPNYAYQLDELVDRYPDARFIVTHRDPGVSVPSTCSVMVHARKLRLPHWEPEDPAAFGAEMLDHFSGAARATMASRRSLDPDRFLDVAQVDLERQPVAVAEAVLAFVGIPMTEAGRSAMDRWALDNQRGSRGEHRYDAADYGLSTAMIRAAFADYLDEFGPLCGL